MQLEDSQIDRFFSGDLNNLPKWRQPLVRIYLSSTFTDMTLEKTALVSEVYPRLKEYCREKYGIEFQVICKKFSAHPLAGVSRFC